MSDRICGVYAISKHIVEGVVARYSLILFESLNESIKRFDGNVMSLDGAFQCDKNGMASISAIHRLQLVTPPGEQV